MYVARNDEMRKVPKMENLMKVINLKKMNKIFTT